MIEERKGMSVIGMISSGKSTFLNSIFGINYLQTKDDITTKFICVIRYSPEIKEPKLYHLKLVPKDNNPDYFNFMKDGNDFIGKKEIKEKIKLINSNENKYSEPQYENLFWMLEINTTYINNINLMKEYDFYDIPGLNEYIRTEKNMDCPPPNIINNVSNDINQINIIEKNPENEENQKSCNYIEGIFKYLKHIIKNFIFIINTESCYKTQNFEIINKLKKIFNFQFRNNLIILNKIDLSEDKQKTILECKQNFINNLEPDILNVDYNTFIPLNSKKFKIEMLMKSKIKYFFLYFYTKYYDKYVMTTIIDKPIISFIEFLKEEMNKKLGNKLDEFLENASQEVQRKELDEIIKIYMKIKGNETKTINFGILLNKKNKDEEEEEEEEEEEDESIQILKGFYKFFKEKIYMPDNSIEIKKIIDYFNNFSLKIITNNKENKKKIKHIFEDKMLQCFESLNNVFKEIILYINEESNNKNSVINLLEDKLRKLKKFILNGLKIYIPFVGISSAGKSSILNCLIGYNLFPESKTNCTTRGIIIQYGEEVELYKVNVNSEDDFYIFEETNEPVSIGKENVKSYLECLNCQIPKNGKNYFYLIKTPIKFFKESKKLNKDFINKIYLVDLPGCDTADNPFNELIKDIEKSPYEKLLNISSSFVFINKGRAITQESNQKIIKKLYKDIKDNSSLGCEYLKNCLFCVNMFENLTEEEKEISKIKRDYSLMLFENNEDQENNSKYLNVSLFNAQSYSEYLRISNELNNKELLMCQFKENYKNKSKKKEFSKFCLSFYKTKLEGLSFPTKIDKKLTFDNSIDNWFIENIMNVSKEENSNIDQNLIKDNSLKLSHLYQCTLKRIKENKYYVDSNCEEFFTNLENQIIGAREYSIKNFKENMEKSFTYFDMLFQKNIRNINSKNKMTIKKESLNIISQLEEIKNNQNIGNIFDKYLTESIDMIEKIQKNSSSLLKIYDNNIEKLIKNEFEEKIQEKTKEFEVSIDKNIEELNKKIEEIKIKILELFKLGLEEEIKEGKYKSEINTLIKFSFTEQFKIKI